jgi:hypothetical protein
MGGDSIWGSTLREEACFDEASLHQELGDEQAESYDQMDEWGGGASVPEESAASVIGQDLGGGFSAAGAQLAPQLEPVVGQVPDLEDWFAENWFARYGKVP